jgi:hypothetical protein
MPGLASLIVAVCRGALPRFYGQLFLAVTSPLNDAKERKKGADLAIPGGRQARPAQKEKGRSIDPAPLAKKTSIF